MNIWLIVYLVGVICCVPFSLWSVAMMQGELKIKDIFGCLILSVFSWTWIISGGIVFVIRVIEKTGDIKVYNGKNNNA